MKKRVLFVFRILVLLGCAAAIVTACDETATEGCAGNAGCCAFEELYGYPFMSSYCTEADLSFEKEACLTPVGEDVGTWTAAECTPPVGTGGCRKASLMPGSTLEEGVTHWTPGYDVYAFGTCDEANQITYGEDDSGDNTGDDFEKSYPNEDSIYNLAIVSQKTDFKESLIQLLVDEYKDRASIDIVKLTNLTKVVPGNYDAIVIMDWCEGDLPSLSEFSSPESDPLNDYIEGSGNSDRVILAVTTGPENDYTCGNDTEVDAITSASSVEDTGSVFSDIATQIDRIIPAA